MKTIKLNIENITGHDIVDVPQDKIQEKVEEQIVSNDRNVTIEKKNGDTEILTQSDIPTDEERQEQEKWAEKFEDVESATAHIKTKGF